MALSFTGAHVPQDIILMGVRWYVAYPLNTRHVEELMLERGVYVDDVIVEGRLGPDGVFAASVLMTSCPSKYQEEKSPTL